MLFRSTDMGISYRRLNNPGEAVKSFRKAHEIDPGHSVSLFNLGIVLRDDVKDLQGALQSWEEFLRQSPDSPHAVMVRPWVKQLQEKVGSSSPRGAGSASEN